MTRYWLVTALPAATLAVARMALAAAPGVPAADPLAPAKVEVVFVHPENYSDIGQWAAFSADNGDKVMAALKAELVRDGRCLVPDQKVEVRFTDIRLAGHPEWWTRQGATADFRVMTEAFWPSMELEYRWTDSSGGVLAEAKEHLADQNYLHHSNGDAYTQRPYPFEQRMLAQWFRSRFCTPAPKADGAG